MSKILCPFCASIINAGIQKCNFCGKNLENCNPQGSLAFASCLNERYTIGKLAESDGEGLTYEGFYNETGQRVLVREYRPLTLGQENAAGELEAKTGFEVLFKTNRMDFADLYRMLQRITPITGLLAVLDVFEANGTVYAVTEKPDGVTLEAYLDARKRLTPAEARTLLQPIMEGVSTMHANGLVHRGISPKNIFVTASGRAVLGGYATLALRTEGSELKCQLYSGFSAPEQYSAEKFAGSYTDVYSLAAVFYKIVTGITPVSAQQRSVNDRMHTARELEAEVPAYFSAVLSHAMRLNAGQRPQNVPELTSALMSQNAATNFLKQTELEQKIPKKEKVQVADIKLSENNRNHIFVLLLIVLSIICVLLMLICGYLMISGRLSDRNELNSSQSTISEETNHTVEVPNFLGKNYNVLSSESYAEDFRFQVTLQFDSTVEKGIVLSQQPAPGATIPNDNLVIALVVSNGIEPVEMPYIIGFTKENAIEELNSRGIQFSLLPLENNGEYVSGCIASTDIEPGTVFNPHERVVNVYVAGDRAIEIIG